MDPGVISWSCGAAGPLVGCFISAHARISPTTSCKERPVCQQTTVWGKHRWPGAHWRLAFFVFKRDSCRKHKTLDQYWVAPNAAGITSRQSLLHVGNMLTSDLSPRSRFDHHFLSLEIRVPMIASSTFGQIFSKLPSLVPPSGEGMACWSILRFWCLLSKKMPNNGGMSQSYVVLIVLSDNDLQTQWVWSSFMASQHCLASFWKQTNIKISPDLDLLLVEAFIRASCQKPQLMLAHTHMVVWEIL